MKKYKWIHDTWKCYNEFNNIVDCVHNALSNRFMTHSYERTEIKNNYHWNGENINFAIDFLMKRGYIFITIS